MRVTIALLVMACSPSTCSASPTSRPRRSTSRCALSARRWAT